MNGLAAKLSELSKAIKAPKFFILGIVILFLALVLLPILKVLAIVLAAAFILISVYPEHDISKQIIRFFKQLK